MISMSHSEGDHNNKKSGPHSENANKPKNIASLDGMPSLKPHLIVQPSYAHCSLPKLALYKGFIFLSTRHKQRVSYSFLSLWICIVMHKCVCAFIV